MNKLSRDLVGGDKQDITMYLHFQDLMNVDGNKLYCVVFIMCSFTMWDKNYVSTHCVTTETGHDLL